MPRGGADPRSREGQRTSGGGARSRRSGSASREVSSLKVLAEGPGLPERQWSRGGAVRPERRHGGGGAAAGELRRERPGCGRGPRGSGSLMHAAGAPSSGRGPETGPPAPARSILSLGPGLRYTSQGRAEHGGESFRSPENIPKSPPSDSEPPVRPSHEHVRIRSQGHRDGPQSFLKSVLPRGTVRPWESVWKAKGGRGGTQGPVLGGEECMCAQGEEAQGGDQCLRTCGGPPQITKACGDWTGE